MSVLLITEIFPPKVGGSGRWFYEIYHRLQDVKCVVAAGSDPLAIDFDASFDMLCMRWQLTFNNWGVLSLSSLTSYIQLFFLLRSAVKSNHITAIHCGRGLPEGFLGWLALKFFSIPYICYVHGEELPAYHSSREYKLLSQLVYSNASRILVNSKNTQKSFVDHTGISDTVQIMYPGVDSSYFVPSDNNEEVRRKLGWHGKKVILTVGRLQKRKGHDHVILALSRIRDCYTDILYAIVGDGEERDYLEDLVATQNLQDHVQFLGKVDDDTILACYQQCDLFILANREVDGDFEGFGMVLIEAQSCGKAVIAGLSGGTSETMVPGETGFLIDANNPSIIADTVLMLLRDDELRLGFGKRAQLWTRNNFDWNLLARQAELVFSKFKL